MHERGDSGPLPLIGVPVAFNASFAVLAARLDYPDILRRPTDEILELESVGGFERTGRKLAEKLPPSAYVALLV